MTSLANSEGLGPGNPIWTDIQASIDKQNKAIALLKGLQVNEEKMSTDSTTESDVGSALPDRWRIALDNRRSRVFGERLNDALASRTAAEQFLFDTDPSLRSGGLRLIIEHWKPVASSEELYRNIALTDPDSEVRVDALSCWSYLYRGSRNEAFSKTLAAFIINESESARFRGNAYIELFTVQGIPVPSKLRVLQSMAYDKNRLLEELDWELVKRFC